MAITALGLTPGESKDNFPRLDLTLDAKNLCHEVVQKRTEKLGQDHADTRECRELLQVLRSELEVMQGGDRTSGRRKSLAVDCGRPWKEVMPERFAAMHTASHFREVRSFLKIYGVHKVLRQLQESEFVASTGHLTTGTKPFNVFARIGSGVMTQPQMNDDQKCLGKYQDKFVVACNRPECDENWESTDPAWIGKASMSRLHRFLVPKNIHWSWFNVLVFGMHDNLEEAVVFLKNLRAATMLYVQTMKGWSSNVGLFFHVYSLSSVNALHLHVIDLDHVGPSYEKLKYRNIALDDVLQCLLEEIAEENASGDECQDGANDSTFAAEFASEDARFETRQVST
jgi:hypothetical protein